MNKYLKMLLNIIAYLLAMPILETIIIIIASIALTTQNVLKGVKTDSVLQTQTIIANYSLIIIAISMTTSFLICWRFFRKDRKAFTEEFGVYKTGFKNNLWAFSSGVSLSLLLAGIMTFLFSAGMIPEYQQGLKEIVSGTNFLFAVLVIGIVAPAFEEILFRGLIYGQLKNNFNVVVSVVVQALIFGAYHGNLIQFVYAVPLGIFFSYSYLKTKTIWTPIAIHIWFNIMNIALDYYAGKEFLVNNVNQIFLIGFLMTLVTMMYIVKSKEVVLKGETESAKDN